MIWLGEGRRRIIIIFDTSDQWWMERSEITHYQIRQTLSLHHRQQTPVSQQPSQVYWKCSKQSPGAEVSLVMLATYCSESKSDDARHVLLSLVSSERLIGVVLWRVQEASCIDLMAIIRLWLIPEPIEEYWEGGLWQLKRYNQNLTLLLNGNSTILLINIMILQLWIFLSRKHQLNI